VTSKGWMLHQPADAGAGLGAGRGTKPELSKAELRAQLKRLADYSGTVTYCRQAHRRPLRSTNSTSTMTKKRMSVCPGTPLTEFV
jgi:hypothetical protein